MLKDNFYLATSQWESCNEEWLRITMVSPNATALTIEWSYYDYEEANSARKEFEKKFQDNPQKLWESLLD